VTQYIGEVCRYLLATPPVPEEKMHKVTKMFGNGLRFESLSLLYSRKYGQAKAEYQQWTRSGPESRTFKGWSDPDPNTNPAIFIEKNRTVHAFYN
jgi:hypothetical protein